MEESNLYNFIKCPACLDSNGINIMDKEVGEPYKMIHCLSCDLVFSEPMKSASANWYETNEYGLAFKVSANDQPHLGWYHEIFFEESLPVKKILDIGCGRGDFIKVAENKGYLVAGIDFDETNIEIARRNFGLKNVYATTIEEFLSENPKKRFDIITFFEVLEHLPDPRSFIKNVKKLLAQEGYIVVSVPNRKRFTNTIAYLDKPPYHLTRWSETALRNFIVQTGFNPILIYTNPIKNEDLTDIIRLGIGQKMLKIGRKNSRQDFIKAANRMYALKYKMSGIFTRVVSKILRIAGCQGNGIYCLAQLKDNKQDE